MVTAKDSTSEWLMKDIWLIGDSCLKLQYSWQGLDMGQLIRKWVILKWCLVIITDKKA